MRLELSIVLVLGGMLSWRSALGQADSAPSSEAEEKPGLSLERVSSDPAYRLMEQRFLEGQLTAREYQRFLRHYKPPVVIPEITNTPDQERALEVLRKQLSGDGGGPNPEPPKYPIDLPEAQPEPSPDNLSLSELEARMNELIRLRQERMKAEETNGPSKELSELSGPLTKRQRLNNLLRLYIRNKITEEEYQVQRAAVIAEPDTESDK